MIINILQEKMTIIIEERDYINGVFKIKLNSPNKYNTLTMNEFIYMCELLNKANQEKELFITMIQSSGKFFSSGGNVTDILSINPRNDDKENQIPGAKLNKLCGVVSSPNVYIPQTFKNHKNPIICCLNGPAIGLSACLVMLCDTIYAPREQINNIYIQFPFTQLGFNLEVASSYTLYKKLGINLSNEFLLFSKMIPGKILLDKGIIYKLISSENIDNFNQLVSRDIILQLSKNNKIKQKTFTDKTTETTKTELSVNNLLEIKKQLNLQFYKGVNNAQIAEISGTLPFWAAGEPQSRFQRLWEGKQKEKRGYKKEIDEKRKK